MKYIRLLFVSIFFGATASAAVATRPVHHITDDNQFIKLDASDSTSFLFSKFMSELASANKKGSNDHTAYARIYFDRLYNDGSNELKKALADMTFRLGEMFDSTFWSGHKKDVAMSMLLRYHFSVITKTLTRPDQKEHAYKLYKHVQAALTPAIRGMKQKIKQLPWMRMAMTAALLGGGAVALRHNTFKKAGEFLGSGSQVIKQLGRDAQEAQRERKAFMRGVIHENKDHERYHYNTDKNAWVKINDNDTIAELKNLTPISRSNRDNGRSEFLVKIGTDSSHDTYLQRKADTFERLGDALEAATPLLQEAGKTMSHNAKVGEEWFKAFNIVKEDPSDTNSFYKMVRVRNQKTGRDVLHYLSSDAAEENEPYAWHNADGRWFKTYLPDRNPIESIADALGSDPVQSLVGEIGQQMNTGRKYNARWLADNGLIENAEDPTTLADGVEIKFDEHSNMYYHKNGIDYKPGLDVIAKLVPALKAISDPSSGPGKLVMAIGSAMHGGEVNYAKWLHSSGITTDENDPFSWKQGVKRLQDPKTKHGYFLVPNPAGTTPHDGQRYDRIDDGVASVDRLFDALGELSNADSDAPLSKLAGNIGHMLANIDGIIASVKRDANWLAVSASEADKEIAKTHDDRLRRLSKQKDLDNLARLRDPEVQRQISGNIARLGATHARVTVMLKRMAGQRPRNKPLEIKLKQKLDDLVKLKNELHADLTLAMAAP